MMPVSFPKNLLSTKINEFHEKDTVFIILKFYNI